MSELTDILLQTTDPVNAVLLILILLYLAEMKKEIERDIDRLRKRTARVEDAHIPDGPRGGSGD